MRRIAVSLSKGGVGKTTTAVNLAAGLAMSGKHVLLVDADTQGHVAAMLGVQPQAGLAELILNECKPIEAVIEARKQLALVPGGRQLARAQRKITQMESGGERVLADALSPLESGYDYVILDTPPGWSEITANALFYADEVLTPIALEAMALTSLMNFQQSLADVQQHHKSLSLRYIVPTFMDRRVKKSAEILAMIKEHYGDVVCQPISYNVRVSEAPGFGQTIFEYDKNCIGAKDYKRLARRVNKDA